MKSEDSNGKKLKIKQRKQSPDKQKYYKGSEEFEMALEHMEKFKPKVWESAITHKHQMSVYEPTGYEPDQETLNNLKQSKDVGFFIGESRDNVTVEQTNNPTPNGSFGDTGVFVHIRSNSSFIPGILILKFNTRRIKNIARETLRLFRWDENSASFHNVFNSGVTNSDYNFVWGRITRPGIYAIFGLNSHPLIIRTVKILSILNDIAIGLKPETQKQLQEKICKIILQLPELRRAIEQPNVLNILKLGSAMEGLPDPLDALKKNPGGFEEPDPDNICPDLIRWPRNDKLPHLSPPFNSPEIRLVDTWNTSRLHLEDSAWRSVGPFNISGQILQVIIDPVDSNKIYAVSASGGLWRLNNVSKGSSASWKPLTDQTESLLTTSAAIAPSNNSIIYITNILGHLLRSPDSGSTWIRMGTQNLGYVRKILVHPSYENLIFVASSNGLWRSLNGGDTWDSGVSGTTDLPLVVGDVTDAVADPDIPSILYIAVRGSGLWKSYGIVDPTVSRWELMHPWSAAVSPKGTMIKIAVGRKGSDANRTVAVKFDQEVFINHRGGRPRTEPGGEDWKSLGKIESKGAWDSKHGKGKNAGDGQGDHNHVIAIDPFHDSVRYRDTDTLDETNILAGAQSLFRSKDGGESWEQVGGYHPDPPGGSDIQGVHPDQNQVTFDPRTENRVYVCNDGGVYKSDDGGSSWTNLNRNLVTSQFWNVGVSGDTALCGMFHVGIVGSKSLNKRLWEGLEGGSWEWVSIYGDPVRPATFYVYGSKLWRYRFPTLDLPKPEEIGSFMPTRDFSALAVDPRSSYKILLVGTQNPGTIMRTKNVHETVPKWNTEPGIDLVSDAIVSIAFAPSTPGMAYAVSLTGRVFRKTDVDSNDAWQEMGQWTVTPKWHPDDGHGIAGARQIAVNALHDDHIYVISYDGSDSANNKIARSDDGGNRWTEISGTGKNSLPQSRYLSVLSHRYDGRTIILGVDAGVFISDDEGQNWYTYDDNLPNTEKVQIFWSENYLYASAHGRGLWRRRVEYFT